jgi:hypothetical protein
VAKLSKSSCVVRPGEKIVEATGRDQELVLNPERPFGRRARRAFIVVVTASAAVPAIDAAEDAGVPSAPP